MVGERLHRVKDGIPKFTKKRVEIARGTLREVETSLRTGFPILVEIDIPPSLSTKFEMDRRNQIKANRREFLEGTFPRFKEFSEKRLLKG